MPQLVSKMSHITARARKFMVVSKKKKKKFTAFFHYKVLEKSIPRVTCSGVMLTGEKIEI